MIEQALRAANQLQLSPRQTARLVAASVQILEPVDTVYSIGLMGQSCPPLQAVRCYDSFDKRPRRRGQRKGWNLWE